MRQPPRIPHPKLRWCRSHNRMDRLRKPRRSMPQRRNPAFRFQRSSHPVPDSCRGRIPVRSSVRPSRHKAHPRQSSSIEVLAHKLSHNMPRRRNWASRYRRSSFRRPDTGPDTHWNKPPTPWPRTPRPKRRSSRSHNKRDRSHKQPHNMQHRRIRAFRSPRSNLLDRGTRRGRSRVRSWPQRARNTFHPKPSSNTPGRWRRPSSNTRDRRNLAYRWRRSNHLHRDMHPGIR